jgi:hypothetical protein
MQAIEFASFTALLGDESGVQPGVVNPSCHGCGTQVEVGTDLFERPVRFRGAECNGDLPAERIVHLDVGRSGRGSAG